MIIYKVINWLKEKTLLKNYQKYMPFRSELTEVAYYKVNSKYEGNLLK